MERKLNILVLMVDAFDGISGAVCRLPNLGSVMIARKENEGRRNFNLAHELFHLLTWDAMPPQYSEGTRETGGNRVEELANNFAGAVLMPALSLNSYGDWSKLAEKELIVRLNKVADEYHVTSSVLGWRLVALGRLTSSVVQSLPEAALRNNGHEKNAIVTPLSFSNNFVKVIGIAIDRGFVSVRRVCRLLAMNLKELKDLLSKHGSECSIDL